MTHEEIKAWLARTESSRNRWTEDEIFRLNGRGAKYYRGGENGVYMEIHQDGGLEIGEYDGAIPYIGEAYFQPVVRKRYGGNTAMRGVVFSHVQLCTDTGEDAGFYMPGIPRSYDNLEEYTEFVDFTELISVSEAKEITATVTPFSMGSGAPRDASQADIDRISKAVDSLDCDPQIAFGWFMGDKFEFTFDCDVDELFNQGMGGIE